MGLHIPRSPWSIRRTLGKLLTTSVTLLDWIASQNEVMTFNYQLLVFDICPCHLLANVFRQKTVCAISKLEHVLHFHAVQSCVIFNASVSVFPRSDCPHFHFIRWCHYAKKIAKRCWQKLLFTLPFNLQITSNFTVTSL